MIRIAPLLTLALLATPVFAGEIGVADPTLDKAPTVTVHEIAGLDDMNFPGAGYSLTQTALWGYHALDWKASIAPAYVVHHPPAYAAGDNGVEDIPDSVGVGVLCQHAIDLDLIEQSTGSFSPYLYTDTSTSPPSAHLVTGEWVCPESPSPIETVAMALLAMDRWGSPTYFDYMLPTATGTTTVATFESITITTPPNSPTLTQACNVQAGTIGQLIDDFVACSWTVPWTIDSVTLRLWTRTAVNGQLTWTQTLTPAQFLSGYLHTQNELTAMGQSITIQHVLDPDDEEVSPDEVVSIAAALTGALHAEAADGSVVSLMELAPAAEVPEALVPEITVIESPEP